MIFNSNFRFNQPLRLQAKQLEDNKPVSATGENDADNNDSAKMPKKALEPVKIVVPETQKPIVSPEWLSPSNVKLIPSDWLLPSDKKPDCSPEWLTPFEPCIDKENKEDLRTAIRLFKGMDLVAFGFTKQEIETYFTLADDFYSLNEGIVIDGKEIKTAKELQEALGKTKEDIIIGEALSVVTLGENMDKLEEYREFVKDFLENFQGITENLKNTLIKALKKYISDNRNKDIVDPATIPNADVEAKDLVEQKEVDIFAGSQKGSMTMKNYDKILESISAIKEQLLNHIEKLCNEQGKAFDRVSAEKELNTIISVVVNKYKGKFEPKDTILDLANKVIDIMVDIYTTEDLKDKVQDLSLRHTYAPDEVSLYGDASLMHTDSYFLTDEEIELKNAMNLASSDMTSSVKDKQKVLNTLDVYEKHLVNYLKIKYPTFSEGTIASIIESSKEIISKTLKPDENGFYKLNEALRSFADLCDKKAQAELE